MIKRIRAKTNYNLHGGLISLAKNQFWRGLSFSMISVFIPIYLLNLGFGLSTIFWYFIINLTTLIVFFPITLIISKRIGYRNILLFNLPIVIVYFLLLMYISQINVSIYFIGFLGGLQEAIFYVPYNGLFSRFSSKEKRGSELSKISIYGQFSGLISPFIGAIILNSFGFNVLSVFACIFIIISGYSIFQIENIKPKTKIKLKGIYDLYKNHKSYFFGVYAQAFYGFTNDIVWPIFIYLTLKNVLSVGYVTILVTFGTLLFTYLVGKLSDNNTRTHLMKIGGLLFAIIWIIRIFFDSSLVIYATSIATGFLGLMIGIPFDSLTYDKASEEKDRDEFMLFREIPIYFGRVSVLIILVIFVENFSLTFLISGLMCLAFVFFKFHKKDKFVEVDSKHKGF